MEHVNFHRRKGSLSSVRSEAGQGPESRLVWRCGGSQTDEVDESQRFGENFEAAMGI